VALGGDAQLVESIGQKAEPGVPSSTFGGKQAQTEPRAVIRFGLLAKNPHIALTRTGIGQFSTCEMARFRKLSRPVSPPGFSLWIISGLRGQMHFSFH
jgi:hypothetical protein